MTVQNAKRWACDEFCSISSTPLLDAEVLLMGATKKSREHLLFKKTEELTAFQEALFRDYVQKRKTGLPVAYIIGKKEFFGYDFFVTPDVLIPKPDTENLVELSLEALKALDLKKEISLCDMCTGSACVGISIIKEAHKMYPQSNIRSLFCDISEEALRIAQKNAKALLTPEEAKKISLKKSNLFSNIEESFDLIVSNPPYIPSMEAEALLLDGRSEPLLALDGGGEDGLTLMKSLVPQAAKHLKQGGTLIVEAGEYNAKKTASLFKEAGFTSVKLHTDMAGNLRNVSGKIANSAISLS